MDAAAKSYGKAAELYKNSHMMLSAILAKIMEWRIKQPPHPEARAFFSAMRAANIPDTPLKNFFNGLPYTELVAVTNRMARVRLPSGQVIKKMGDVENDLYFIAAGSIKDTIYQPLNQDDKTQQKTSIYLTVDDVFGDVFPLEDEKFSQSYTETVSGVELARISKKRLKEVCKKYPNVAKALVVLLESASKNKYAIPARGVRSANRYPLPLSMNLEIFPDGSEDAPIVLKGYSRDISVGGVCIVLDGKYANAMGLIKSLRGTEIQVCFPGESLHLNVSGNVVWSKKVFYEGDTTLALGIQFNAMTPKMRGMLVVFADMIYNN
jgi:CRP-like cAMP-binding protein